VVFIAMIANAYSTPETGPAPKTAVSVRPKKMKITLDLEQIDRSDLAGPQHLILPDGQNCAWNQANRSLEMSLRDHEIHASLHLTKWSYIIYLFTSMFVYIITSVYVLASPAGFKLHAQRVPDGSAGAQRLPVARQG
jgi:hypothetical protein